MADNQVPSGKPTHFRYVSKGSGKVYTLPIDQEDNSWAHMAEKVSTGGYEQPEIDKARAAAKKAQDLD